MGFGWLGPSNNAVAYTQVQATGFNSDVKILFRKLPKVFFSSGFVGNALQSVSELSHCQPALATKNLSVLKLFPDRSAAWALEQIFVCAPLGRVIGIL
jgi:hypothetical protein